MRLLLVVNPSASSVTARGRVVITKALSADHDVTVATMFRALLLEPALLPRLLAVDDLKDWVRERAQAAGAARAVPNPGVCGRVATE